MPCVSKLSPKYPNITKERYVPSIPQNIPPNTVFLIVLEIIFRGVKKYIAKRIKRDLELLDRLEEIEKDIDNKIDGLKIMIYDRYLDRCRVGMKKQREEDKGLRDKLTEIESKCSK